MHIKRISHIYRHQYTFFQYQQQPPWILSLSHAPSLSPFSFNFHIFFSFLYIRIEKNYHAFMMKPTIIPLKHLLLLSLPHPFSLFLDFFIILRLKWNEWYNTCTLIYLAALIFLDDGSSLYIIYAFVMLHRKIKTLFFLHSTLRHALF